MLLFFSVPPENDKDFLMFWLSTERDQWHEINMIALNINLFEIKPTLNLGLHLLTLNELNSVK